MKADISDNRAVASVKVSTYFEGNKAKTISRVYIGGELAFTLSKGN